MHFLNHMKDIDVLSAGAGWGGGGGGMGGRLSF